MLNSIVLDVAIGMAFVYLLLSLIASVVQEILSTFMQLRSANLQRAIRSLVSGASTSDGEPLIDSIYGHGLIRGLFSDPAVDSGAMPPKGLLPKLWSVIRRWDWLREFLRHIIGLHPGDPITTVSNQMLLPAYIPAPTFAMALIDLLRKSSAPANASVPANPPDPANPPAPANAPDPGNITMQQIVEFLGKDHPELQQNKVTEALLTLANDAQGDLKKFQTNLENWYSAAMDRASGWYKKYAQSMLLVIGMILAVTFNVDTIRVAQTLWGGKDVRDKVVAAAGSYLKDHPNPPVSSSSPAPNGQASTPPSQPAAPPNSNPGSTFPTQPTASAGSPSTPTTPDPNQEKAQLQATIKQFNDVTSSTLLPVGWSDPERWGTRFRNILCHPCTSLGHLWDRLQRVSTWQLLLGWLLTALAISLGAPFWFDTLNRFMVVRGTVKPSEKSGPDPSKG